MKPAQWLSKAIGFAPAVRTGAVRLHWYGEGEEGSACGNYKRPFMAYGWANPFELCVRCLEELQRVGETVLPPTPPPASDDDDDDGPNVAAVSMGVP